MKEVKEYYHNGQILQHYWKNEKGTLEGEYKDWMGSGQLWSQCFYKNGMSQGEYKIWDKNDQTETHCFYHNSEVVDISEYVQDVNNITESEYFLLQITFGYFPIFKFDGKL